MIVEYGPSGSMNYTMVDTANPDTVLIDYELTDQEMGEVRCLVARLASVVEHQRADFIPALAPFDVAGGIYQVWKLQVNFPPLFFLSPLPLPVPLLSLFSFFTLPPASPAITADPNISPRHCRIQFDGMKEATAYFGDYSATQLS